MSGKMDAGHENIIDLEREIEISKIIQLLRTWPCDRVRFVRLGFQKVSGFYSGISEHFPLLAQEVRLPCPLLAPETPSDTLVGASQKPKSPQIRHA